jgi:O-antigen ligase
MKELILTSPLTLAFTISIGLIYFFVVFHYVGQDKKLATKLEFSLALLFVFILSSGGISFPFDKLHFKVLGLLATTAPTIGGIIGIYTACILLLSSRLRHTLKDFSYVLSVLINKDPSLCLIFLLVSFSVFWSETPIFTLRNSITYLLVSLFAIYIGKQYSWKDISLFLRWTTLCILLFSLKTPSDDGSGHWSGILGHKNPFSFFMAQTVIWWLLHAVYSPKHRGISIAIVLTALFGLQKGGSGAGKVIFITLLCLWGYFGVLKKLPPRLAFLSVIIFMIIGLCLTFWVTENIKFIVVDTLNKDMTLTGRTDFWPQILAKIMHRPLLGYGVGGFWQPWRGSDNPAADIIVAKSLFRPQHSHNGFLELGVELGFLGLLLFVISLFSNIAKAIMHLSYTKQPEGGLPLLLLTYALMTNLTETGLLGVTIVWFWYVVLTVRLSLDTTGSLFSNEINGGGSMKVD